MKRKVLIITLSLIVFIILFGIVYVVSGTMKYKDKMWDDLHENGYQQTEIKSLRVYHSFINRILGDHEWSISVVYENEPTLTYHYSVYEGEIIEIKRANQY